MHAADAGIGEQETDKGVGLGGHRFYGRAKWDAVAG
jgi:hypothetical protein